MMNQENSSKTRVIKKYGSRRLYDTSTSTYISFVGLGKIIADGFEVSIYDAKTKDDLTQITLASYLSENTYILNFCSDDLLRLIIKNQSHSRELREFLRSSLDKSLTYWSSIS